MVTAEEWDRIRTALNQDVTEGGEWAGAPIPVHDIPLRLEPRYPYAGLNGFCFRESSEPSPESVANTRIVNSWYSHRYKSVISIFQDAQGYFALKEPQYGGPALLYWIKTLGVSGQVWSVAAEIRACELLSEHVSRPQFRTYMLSGTFLETSKRSGVCYLFRKLRPTVALRGDRSGEMRVLAVLCLHPIGYYEGTWAGVMTPTDDVLSHLLMMRADEKKFWGKANHHPVGLNAAGL